LLVIYSTAIPLPLNSDTTLKAIAYKSTWADSAVAAGVFAITGTVATPTFSLAAGTYSSAQSLTLSTATPGATIRYTTDDSTPSASAGLVYSSAISLPSSTTMTVRAIAYEGGWIDSGIASAAYVVTGTVAAPGFNPGAGTYTAGQTVTLSSATSGATIRYTTDGSAPTKTTGTLYAGAITITGPVTLRAIRVSGHVVGQRGDVGGLRHAKYMSGSCPPGQCGVSLRFLGAFGPAMVFSIWSGILNGRGCEYCGEEVRNVQFGDEPGARLRLLPHRPSIISDTEASAS